MVKCASYKKLLLLLLMVIAYIGVDENRAISQQSGGFGSWGLACQAIGPNQTRCALFQRQVRENGALLLDVQLVGLEKETTSAVTVTAPLGVWLDAGVSIRVDNGTAVQQEFRVCSTSGCTARFDSTEIIQALDAGLKLEVSYAAGPEPGQTLRLEISLIGVREGIEAIRIP